MPGLRADASNQNCDVPPEVFADISSRMGAGPFVASNNVWVAQIAGALAMAFNWAASDGHWRIHKRATIRPAGVAIMPPMPHRMSPSSISRALCPAPICCVGVNPFATISRSDFHSGTVSSSAEGMRIISHAFDLRPRRSKSADIVLRNCFALARKRFFQRFSDAFVLLGGELCLKTRNIAVRNRISPQLLHSLLHGDIPGLTSNSSRFGVGRPALSNMDRC